MAPKISGSLTQGGKLTPAGRVILQVLGAVFILGTVASTYKEFRLAAGGEQADATVVAVRTQEDRPDFYEADIHYTTLDGAKIDTTITAQKQRRVAPPRPGEIVPIRYSRSNVQDAVLQGRHAAWPGALIFIAVGTFCVWLARH